MQAVVTCYSERTIVNTGPLEYCHSAERTILLSKLVGINKDYIDDVGEMQNFLETAKLLRALKATDSS